MNWLFLVSRSTQRTAQNALKLRTKKQITENTCIFTLLNNNNEFDINRIYAVAVRHVLHLLFIGSTQSSARHRKKSFSFILLCLLLLQNEINNNTGTGSSEMRALVIIFDEFFFHHFFLFLFQKSIEEDIAASNYNFFRCLSCVLCTIQTNRRQGKRADEELQIIASIR